MTESATDWKQAYQFCRDKVDTVPYTPRPSSSKTDNLQSRMRETIFVNLAKSVKLPSGTTYRYIFSSPRDTQKPFLLFLHGFPETSYGWHHQILYFIEQGYGIIAPDLLGYGGTDKPGNLEAYNFKHMAAHLGELLDFEGVDTTIGIAHDL